MKIVNNKTRVLLIKATVQSDWDFCNCAKLYLSDSGLKELKRYDKRATEIKKKEGTSFSCLCFYDYVEFMNVDEGIMELPNIFNYIEEEDDTEGVTYPEQTIDDHMIKLYGDGQVCWVGYGKHTGEEFWTDTININEL